MHFTKWQACGNDFVFINAAENPDIKSISDQAKLICDRHYGVGADGVIFILPSAAADLKMRIFNSDGSEAEMCGNGIRAFAKWASELGLVNEKKISVETGAGILYPELLDDGNVRVDMGVPHLSAKEIPVLGFGDGTVVDKPLINGGTGKHYQVSCVSMGNPHCVIFVDDVNAIDLPGEGHQLEIDAHFPNKTNVEFAQKLSGNHFRMRVWERGTGITLACGTGTCAAVVAAILNGFADKSADVDLDGGSLHIDWAGSSKDHVYMTGPAVKVFEGDISL